MLTRLVAADFCMALQCTFDGGPHEAAGELMDQLKNGVVMVSRVDASHGNISANGSLSEQLQSVSNNEETGVEEKTQAGVQGNDVRKHVSRIREGHAVDIHFLRIVPREEYLTIW